MVPAAIGPGDSGYHPQCPAATSPLPAMADQAAASNAMQVKAIRLLALEFNAQSHLSQRLW